MLFGLLYGDCRATTVLTHRSKNHTSMLLITEKVVNTSPEKWILEAWMISAKAVQPAESNNKTQKTKQKKKTVFYFSPVHNVIAKWLLTTYIRLTTACMPILIERWRNDKMGLRKKKSFEHSFACFCCQDTVTGLQTQTGKTKVEAMNTHIHFPNLHKNDNPSGLWKGGSLTCTYGTIKTRRPWKLTLWLTTV